MVDDVDVGVMHDRCRAAVEESSAVDIRHGSRESAETYSSMASR